jgi:hydrogenase nickel incorporation protein HypA/HybF
MHELSIAMSMVEMAAEEAARHGAERVDALYLKLGRLSGVVKDALLFSWEIACEGTPVQGARLVIEEMPIVVHCPTCDEDKTLEAINAIFCPVCDTPTPDIRQGKEMEVTAMEIV